MGLPRRLRSFVPLLAVVLTLATPLAAGSAVVPDATATAGTAPEGASGSADQVAGSPIPGLLNVQTVLTDAEHDSELEPFGEDAVPADDAKAPIDIVALTIGETDGLFLFALQHRAYPASEGTLSSYTFMEAECTVDFHVDRNENVTWRLELDYMMPYSGGDYETSARLVSIATIDGDYDEETVDRLDTELVDDAYIALVVPKDLLLAGLFERQLQTGDRLTGFDTTCSRNAGAFFTRYEDRATAEPTADGYQISLAASTDEIALALPEDASRDVAVAVGRTSKLTLEVRNLLQRKVLVNVTAAVVGGDGVPLPGWKVTAAPTLELRSNGSVPASVIVAVDEEVVHRDSGILKVVAYPLGYEEKATFTARVFATVPPSPEQPTLHFHRGDPDGFFCSGLCIGPGPLPVPLWDGSADFFFMNVLEDDPVFQDTEGVDDGIAMLSTDVAFARLDAPLGTPLRLDPDGFFTLALGLRSAVAREVAMEATVYTWSGATLARLETEIELTEASTTHTFTLPVRGEVMDIPRDDRIGIEFRFNEGGLPGIVSFGEGTTLSSVEWHPDRSSFTLPLVAVPETTVNITDGRALPSIVIDNRTDRMEYVNPGKTQVFDLVLLNEGTTTDSVRLTSEASSPGWSFTFDPGNQFRLEPGAAAPLCMAVTAPDDAKEGDVLNITLTATSKVDAQVKTQLGLTLVVTDGVPIEPEACREVPEDEYVAPIVEEKESPAVAPLTVAVTALAALAWRRRRA